MNNNLPGSRPASTLSFGLRGLDFLLALLLAGIVLAFGYGLPSPIQVFFIYLGIISSVRYLLHKADIKPI